MWHETQSADASPEPGLRHIYSTERHGHALSATSLSTGKQKWVFPRRPSFFSWRDPLRLPAKTKFFGPSETRPPEGAPNYDHPLRALTGRALRTRSLAAPVPSPAGPVPAQPPWLVLVASQNPGHHLYAVTEDTGELVWEFVLDSPGANITAITLVDELPSLVLLSVVDSRVEEGGVFGFMVAVDLVNGTKRWETGVQPGGAPSVALATPRVLVLRGPPDADLQEMLYGVLPATGGEAWSKQCGRGCNVLQLDERTAVIASYIFMVNELEAVDLVKGTTVWTGYDTSTDPNLSCTGPVVAHKHIFFGCSCEEDEAEQASGGESSAGDGGRQHQPQDATPAKSAAAAARLLGSVTEADGGDAAGVDQRHHGGGGSGDRGAQLCGYSMSADNGEVVWRSKLGDNSSFPPQFAGSRVQPLVVGDAVLLASQAAVHALDRADGRRRWTFWLPAGQEAQAWDFLDEDSGVVIVRTTGVPPADSRLYGIDLFHGGLLINETVPQSLGREDGTALPYDIRDGVAYTDACSGSHCCVMAVDLLADAPPPQPPNASTNAVDAASVGGPRTDSSVISRRDSGILAGVQAQLRRALAEASAAGLGAWPLDTPRAGVMYTTGGGGAGRSFSYCFDVAQACRAKRARSVGTDVVYVLLATQLVLVIVGFGSVVAWRLCCRARYAPYTRLNALPVLEVLQHDVASEEPDDGSEGGEEEDGGLASRRVTMVVDEQAGVAVPVVQVPVAGMAAVGNGGAAAVVTRAAAGRASTSRPAGGGVRGKNGG